MKLTPFTLLRKMTAHRTSPWRATAQIAMTALAALAALTVVVATTPAARAQVSVGISLPGVSIGINVPVYPTLVRVPGHPVYWDPRGTSNYFFVDGLYWVYRSDNWYQSTWYDGPWRNAGPDAVPVVLLRVPVRYYRQPPPHFRPWRSDAAPRWGEHWGPDWEQRRPDWDRRDRRSAAAPAPLPVYQREYRGDRYPPPQQQDDIRRERSRPVQPQEVRREARPKDRDDDPRDSRGDNGPGLGRDPGNDRGRDNNDKPGEKRDNKRDNKH